ncbi:MULTISPECIES: hypothetical protein [unclassified Spirillospora]|uniref:hypothetical protein n=1 Tax=unclassified Spirillospora TaxID=2642701 RepID=UPI003716CB28
MIWTGKERGLALLTAAPLLGAVPLGAGAHADEGVVLRTAAPKKDVMPGRTYEWTFKVTAKGPAKSGKAVFRTTLPESLEFVSGEKNCTSKEREVVCRLGTVRKGRSVKGVVRAKVSGRAEGGQEITVRGKATWGKADAARRFPAVRVAKAADLALTEAAPATARAGAKIPYVVRVANLGPSGADNVIVEFRGPLKVVGQDAACVPRGRVHACAVGSLGPAQSRTLHIQAVPSEKVRAGTVLESSWKATSPTTDVDESNNDAVARTRILESR